MDNTAGNFLATITIKQDNESELFSAIQELKAANEECECHCHCIDKNIQNPGLAVARYSLDLDYACLEYIKQRVDIVRLTVTEYTKSPVLGLMVAKTANLG